MLELQLGLFAFIFIAASFLILHMLHGLGIM